MRKSGRGKAEPAVTGWQYALSGSALPLLLRSVGGSSGFWDEVVSIGLIAGMALVVAAFVLSGGRGQKRRRKR